MENRSLRNIECVEPRGDQGGERLWNGQGREVADRDIPARLEPQAPTRDKHAHRFDGVQRYPICALYDCPCGRFREPGHQSGDQFAHLRLLERLQDHRVEVALARAPVSPLVE